MGKKGNGEHHDLALTLTSVLVIAGVLSLQIGARKLKRYTENQRHAGEVLEASEREMTILGIIAFGLFVLEELAKEAKGEWYDVFKEIHWALFTVAVFYVGLNVLLYVMSKRFGRRWHEYEDEELTNHGALVERSRELRQKLNIKPLEQHYFFGSFWLRGLCRNPCAFLEYQRCLEANSFHEIRRDFLRSHHLPHEFNFAGYLESCLQHVCLEFSEIRESVWVAGVLLLVIQLYATTIGKDEMEVNEMLVWLAGGTIFLGFLVFFKVKWIFWYLVHSEVVHTSDDDGPATIERANLFQRSLFWFSNPSLVVTLLEMNLFALATTFSVLMFNVRELEKKGELWPPLFAFLLAGWILFVLLPRILPRFTLITHVGAMTDPRRLAEAVTKQQQRGGLGYKKILSLRRQQSVRVHFKKNVLPLIWHSVVEADAINQLSALLAILYVFGIAVTQDAEAARALVGDGSVIAIRSIELGLVSVFVIESCLRLNFKPYSTSRWLDLFNCGFCFAAALTHHILWHTTNHREEAKVLHALSATIVFRVFNTAWHRELIQPRFEHIRLTTEELVHSHSHGHGHGHGHGHAPKPAPSTRSTTSDDVFSSRRNLGGPMHVVNSRDNLTDFNNEHSVQVVSSGVDYEKGHKLQKQRSNSHPPAWLAFYVPPDETGIIKSDDRGPSVKAAENLVHDLVVSALEDAADQEQQASVVELARAALARSLAAVQTAVDKAVSHENADPNEPADSEELEDTLYFNHVLHVATAVATQKHSGQSSFMQHLGIGHGDKDGVDKRVCRVFLTRDQIVYYPVDSTLTMQLENGKVVQASAKSATPAALSLRGADARPPAGHLHLSTVLKIDVHKKEVLTIVTTGDTYVFTFFSKTTNEAAMFKAHIEDAIAHEDDDDPLHPLLTSTEESKEAVVKLEYADAI